MFGGSIFHKLPFFLFLQCRDNRQDAKNNQTNADKPSNEVRQGENQDTNDDSKNTHPETCDFQLNTSSQRFSQFYNIHFGLQENLKNLDGIK